MDEVRRRSMKAVIVILLSVLISAPALAGAPVNGIYKSTDLGGLMLPGRYSESWFPGPLAVNNTLNEQSWDGATLGTQWHWYCPWIVGKALQSDNVNVLGNGQKVWIVTYTGGYCWLDGGGPWAGGDASYLANINTWTATVTETYSAFVEVGTVRNHSANATFIGFNQECMDLNVTNVEKLGDTNGGPLPATFPLFWNWIGCAPTASPGEWGDVDGITFVILGCTVGVEESSWGAVKAMYRD
jgi:hypothetical protein